MACVGRAVGQESFDEEQIKKLRKNNLLELPSELFQMICDSLDSYTKWRDVIALADGLSLANGSRPFALNALEVERLAIVNHRDLTASPTRQLLMHWGQRNMIGETLVVLLNGLRIERPLKYLKFPEELVITVQPESSLVALEGSDLVLDCEAVGFPYPVYEWFKEKRRIESGISDVGRLVISNVTAAMAGLYTCRIHHVNHVTSAVEFKFTEWCKVEFKARPMGLPQSQPGLLPVITKHPSPQTLRQYDTLELCCLAQSSSPVDYHWVRNGTLLTTVYGSQLQIPQVDVTDAGEYYCIVRSAVGEVRSSSAAVTVTTKPWIQAPQKPQLLRQPVDLSVGVGGDAVFVVEAQFVSKLTYQWFRNDESMPGAVDPELRFPVEDASSAGTYQCVVTCGEDQLSVLTRRATLTVTAGNIVYKAADKLALLIGVSTYKTHSVPLPAVKIDLQETVKVLERMQFKVVSLLDLTLAEMHDAIDMFCDLLSTDVYTIFYCAGHGFIGNEGRHYLIPWDASSNVSQSECICIEFVQERIQQKKPKLMMFCLDICRKRLKTQPGARDPEPTARDQVSDELSAATSLPNRIVLYASSEGQQAFEEKDRGDNRPRGLFNRYLLEVIEERVGAMELYKKLMDKFRTSLYRTSPFFRQNYPMHPAMTASLEESERSLHDPLDTKRFRDTINRQTVLWHRVHQLPENFDIPLGSKIGKVVVGFSRVTSNVMDLHVKLDLASDYGGSAGVTEDFIPPALRPVETTVNKATSSTSIRLQNLQRLREDLNVGLQVELRHGSSRHRWIVKLNLHRPLISFAFVDRVAPPTPALSSLLAETERKEASEHTEDHSLNSEA